VCVVKAEKNPARFPRCDGSASLGPWDTCPPCSYVDGKRMRSILMRPQPYTGPEGSNDFADLTADEMSELVSSYKLLGDCFEDTATEDMFGRGFWMDEPLELVK
jgi:hypothetical protein